MKSTGVVRKLDELGRITLPIELRRILAIKERDPLEIFVEEDLILLRKYKSQKACAITGDITNENKQYGENLFLSPEGARILMEELKKYQAEF